MLAPTEIKNIPNNKLLNGSISLSSSWRYSLSAKTTPAKKVPSAADKPTASIANAIPTPSASAVAMKISRERDPAIMRNSGTTRQ